MLLFCIYIFSIKAVSQCSGKDEDSLKKCARQAGYPNPLTKHSKGVEASNRDDGWSCLAMQLWAEINTAVATFGNRCLLPPAPPLTLPQQEQQQQQQQQHTGDYAAAAATTATPTIRPLLATLQPNAKKKQEIRRRKIHLLTAQQQQLSSSPPPLALTATALPPPSPPRYVAWHSEDAGPVRSKRCRGG